MEFFDKALQHEDNPFSKIDELNGYQELELYFDNSRIYFRLPAMLTNYEIMISRNPDGVKKIKNLMNVEIKTKRKYGKKHMNSYMPIPNPGNHII